MIHLTSGCAALAATVTLLLTIPADARRPAWEMSTTTRKTQQFGEIRTRPEPRLEISPREQSHRKARPDISVKEPQVVDIAPHGTKREKIEHKAHSQR